MLDHPGEALAIDLHPSSPDQRQAVGTRQQLFDFRGGQGLAVESDCHAEIEKRIEPQSRGLLPADLRRNLRPRRTVPAPGRRHAHDHACRFQLRNVFQKPHGLLRPPAGGMIDLSLFHGGLQPPAFLGRPLHRKQQREQAIFIGRARILSQCLAQRKMLCFGLGRQPRGIGCQKGKRRGFIFAVLGQVEVDAAHQVPRRVAPLQEVLNSGFRFGQFQVESRVQFLPERLQNVCRQILRPGHRRRGQSERIQFSRSRRRNRGFLRTGPGLRQSAERGYVMRAKFPPPGKRRRNRDARLARAQLQKSVSRAARKSVAQTPRKLWVECGRVLFMDEIEMTVGRQDRDESDWVHREKVNSFRSTWQRWREAGEDAVKPMRRASDVPAIQARSE